VEAMEHGARDSAGKRFDITIMPKLQIASSPPSESIWLRNPAMEYKLVLSRYADCRVVKYCEDNKDAKGRHCYARTLGTSLSALWHLDWLLYGYGIVPNAGCHSWNPLTISLSLCVPLTED